MAARWASPSWSERSWAFLPEPFVGDGRHEVLPAALAIGLGLGAACAGMARVCTALELMMAFALLRGA